MHDEYLYSPQLDFNLSSYQRNEAGEVADIEEARQIIRNLQKIVRLLAASPFEQLPLNTQAEILLYLVGTHLLTRQGEQTQGGQDDQYAAQTTLLETLFNKELDETLRREKTMLNPQEILLGVENLFKDFGK